MDSEIQRWRAIATTGAVSSNQRAVLVPRKKREKVNHERQALRKEIKATDFSYKKEMGVISKLLDNASLDQKNDNMLVWKGYLNPNTMNSAFKEHSRNFKCQEEGALEEEIDKNIIRRLSKIPQITSGANAHQKRNIVDLLEEYDSVNSQRIVNSVMLPPPEPETKPIKDHEPSKRQIIPNIHLNVTMADKYKTVKTIENAVIEKNLAFTKQRVSPKTDRLEEHYKQLKWELEEASCVESGPDMTRLQVYGRCFDKIISEFKTYGPILADIKKCYESFIYGFQANQDELQFLRTKVQKLIAQNENRMLLKLEKKKCKRFQEEVKRLNDERQSVHEEMKRKLVYYSTYIPDHVFQIVKNDDPALLEIEKQVIQSTEAGDDIITVYESRIMALEKDVIEKSGEISELKTSIETEFVLKEQKDIVDEDLIFTKDKLLKVTDINRDLETQLKQMMHEIDRLQKDVLDKQQSYFMLQKEYQELTEAVAHSFDERLKE